MLWLHLFYLGQLAVQSSVSATRDSHWGYTHGRPEAIIMSGGEAGGGRPLSLMRISVTPSLLTNYVIH